MLRDVEREFTQEKEHPPLRERESLAVRDNAESKKQLSELKEASERQRESQIKEVRKELGLNEKGEGLKGILERLEDFSQTLPEKKPEEIEPKEFIAMMIDVRDYLREEPSQDMQLLDAIDKKSREILRALTQKKGSAFLQDFRESVGEAISLLNKQREASKARPEERKVSPQTQKPVAPSGVGIFTRIRAGIRTFLANK